jgi:hypothetical protein
MDLVGRTLIAEQIDTIIAPAHPNVPGARRLA